MEDLQSDISNEVSSFSVLSADLKDAVDEAAEASDMTDRAAAGVDPDDARVEDFIDGEGGDDAGGASDSVDSGASESLESVGTRGIGSEHNKV